MYLEPNDNYIWWVFSADINSDDFINTPMTSMRLQHYLISCREAIMNPDSKVHGANMGPIWGRQDPGGPHVGPMNFAIWVVQASSKRIIKGPLALCVGDLK